MHKAVLTKRWIKALGAAYIEYSIDALRVTLKVTANVVEISGPSPATAELLILTSRIIMVMLGYYCRSCSKICMSCNALQRSFKLKKMGLRALKDEA